jgi:hypothetical protein
VFKEAKILSRRTVDTIIRKGETTDRTTDKRRIRFNLPLIPRPKRRKWSFNRVAKQADELKKTRDLIREAKGLGRGRAGK